MKKGSYKVFKMKMKSYLKEINPSSKIRADLMHRVKSIACDLRSKVYKEKLCSFSNRISFTGNTTTGYAV